MDWGQLQDATAQNEKPAPGWLIQAICNDVLQQPQDIPNCAEYLMQCISSNNSTVRMKACIVMYHISEKVPGFRQYMQQCPGALHVLDELATPPALAISQNLERPEVKVGREAAKRALLSCISPVSRVAESESSSLKQRIQGFGNFQPPSEEQPKEEGAVGMVAGFVGDALADTVDDFREKGAVGAVRDGVADAADLILDGVGAVWDFLGGRRNRPPPRDDRICRPVADNVAARFRGKYGPEMAANAAAAAQQRRPGAGSSQSGFGKAAVGAKYGLQVSSEPQAATPASSSSGGAGSTSQKVEPPPAAPKEPPPDLLSFEDEPSDMVPSSSGASEDLLGLDLSTDAAIAAGSPPRVGMALAMQLKNQGNEKARMKRHAEATKDYEAALEALTAGGEATNAAPGLKALRATLNANLAMCFLSQELYRRAVDAATRALQDDPTHAKAHYRRCLAHKKLKMFADARRDLEALQNFCTHDLSPSELERLRQGLDAADGGGGAADV